jgi:hypothetical protein
MSGDKPSPRSWAGSTLHACLQVSSSAGGIRMVLVYLCQGKGRCHRRLPHTAAICSCQLPPLLLVSLRIWLATAAAAALPGAWASTALLLPWPQAGSRAWVGRRGWLPHEGATHIEGPGFMEKHANKRQGQAQQYQVRVVHVACEGSHTPGWCWEHVQRTRRAWGLPRQRAGPMRGFALLAPSSPAPVAGPAMQLPAAAPSLTATAPSQAAPLS